ncbi:MAG: DUF354 domain-containing protein [Bacteroidales bacterium]|jgi:hypothetical protein|nr:DUF354 domain-containing protein [Bacteroidales bacterium]
MNILFDLNHPVDVNFFKNATQQLAKEGHSIILTYRERGLLGRIVHYELGQFDPICIGTHKRNFIRKVIGQLLRDYRFLIFQKRKHIDLSVCFGPTNAIASWVNRIPYLAFEDDAEYKIPFYHANLFATRHIMPDFIKINKKNIFKFHGFKELAYLHPDYFQPNPDVLNKFNLEVDKYIFIREIANVSLNYQKENPKIQQIIELLVNKGFKIVLSLENKKFVSRFEKDCIILEEPVEDIYSLIKYSRFVISSGDTLARESCLQGVPTLYTGGRIMAMNSDFIESGCMIMREKTDEVLAAIDILLDKDIKKNTEKITHDRILNQWEDTTMVILKHIRDFIK